MSSQEKHMCDLTWEVKVTHKQLNTPDPSISKLEVVFRAQQLPPLTKSTHSHNLSSIFPSTSPYTTESSPSCQKAADGDKLGAGRTLQDSEDDTTQLAQKTE
ncbi:hypothetical protein P7K49_020362, partial [Saguinus oedipus]